MKHNIVLLYTLMDSCFYRQFKKLADDSEIRFLH
jgi:hypothetical protein